MSEKTGIQRALEKFDGSASKLASAVGNGVLRQHVEHWLGAGRVSAEKTPDVAAVTGIPEEELNDRVNWEKVRQNKALQAAAPSQHSPADAPSGAAGSLASAGA